MLHIEDSITRKLVLPASRPEVWRRSFGSPAALSSWFPERVEGDFSVGQSFFLIWGEHRCEARLVECEPESVLAYQWHPGVDATLAHYPESQLTTVRFTLADAGSGTEVTMIETGFRAIAESRAQWAFDQNNGGWDEELPKLAACYK